MTKIVINATYGGFALSSKAVKRYADLKGSILYPEGEEHGFITYWAVPPGPCQESGHDLLRDDPILVQVVEELKEASSGKYAKLVVVEIPDDAEWQIEEYDGSEWIAEKHRTWGGG